MSLIQYIFKALKPTIYCEDNILLSFLTLSGALTDINISSEKINTNYDIVLTSRFEKDLYDLLNYDGFYFFHKGTLATKDDYEYFHYAGFCIVKKIHKTLDKLASIPYCLLSHQDGISECSRRQSDPIILRNFDGKFNIIPYVEPYEIIDHPSIIEGLCREHNVKRYLELGVRGCPVPERIKNIVPTIVGVDTSDIQNFPGTFYRKTTDEYFKMCKSGEITEPTFNMIFIDACHDFEYVKRDFINSLLYIKVSGIILLHDTYPAASYMTDKNLCSDAYKIVDYIRNCGLQVLNLPISPGLCIVRV